MQRYCFVIVERMMNMEAKNLTNMQDSSYAINGAIGVLLSQLDEAIDDMENGRVLSEEELWSEIDTL